MNKKILLSTILGSLLLGSSVQASKLTDLTDYYIGTGVVGNFIDGANQYGGELIVGKKMCKHGDLEIRIGGLNNDNYVGETFTTSFFVKPNIKLDGEWERTKLYGLAGVSYYDYKKNSYSDFNGWTSTIGLGSSYNTGYKNSEVFIDWTTSLGNKPFGENNNKITIGFIKKF